MFSTFINDFWMSGNSRYSLAPMGKHLRLSTDYIFNKENKLSFKLNTRSILFISEICSAIAVQPETFHCITFHCISENTVHYPSICSPFKHLGKYVCINRYHWAHLYAVIVLILRWHAAKCNSADGIRRGLVFWPRF